MEAGTYVNDSILGVEFPFTLQLNVYWVRKNFPFNKGQEMSAAQTGQHEASIQSSQFVVSVL